MSVTNGLLIGSFSLVVVFPKVRLSNTGVACTVEQHALLIRRKHRSRAMARRLEDGPLDDTPTTRSGGVTGHLLERESPHFKANGRENPPTH